MGHLAAQPAEPNDNGSDVAKAAKSLGYKAEKIQAWFSKQTDSFFSEAVKEAGKQFGKWGSRAFCLYVIEKMFALSELVAHWLKLLNL